RCIETMLPAGYGGRDLTTSDRVDPGLRNASHWLNREAATRAIWTRIRWAAPRAARAADAAPVSGRAVVHERRGDQRVGGGATACDGSLSRSAQARARPPGPALAHACRDTRRHRLPGAPVRAIDHTGARRRRGAP